MKRVTLRLVILTGGRVPSEVTERNLKGILDPEYMTVESVEVVEEDEIEEEDRP